MNITEQLLSSNVSNFTKRKTKVIKSSRLADCLGVKKAVDVTIKEIPYRLYNEIANGQYDEDGRINPDRMVDMAVDLVVEGVAEPDLRNKDLMEHFGVRTPEDLAVLLFDNEIAVIGEKINELCSYEDVKDRVKN